MNATTARELFKQDGMETGLASDYRGKLRLGLGLLILIVLFTAWLVLTLMRPDILPVRNVRVQGEFRQLSPDRLQAIVIDTVRGGFFNVNVEVIRQVLLDDPWVQGVTVKRIWPDTVMVTVTEHKAVARWRDHGLINSFGEYFSADRDTFPAGLPELSGPEGTHELMLTQYYLFESQLEETGMVISRLSLNERRAWTAQLAQGPLLVLGRKNITERMNRFLVFSNSDLVRHLNAVESIDLRYTNGFAVRWKTNLNEPYKGLDYHG